MYVEYPSAILFTKELPEDVVAYIIFDARMCRINIMLLSGYSGISTLQYTILYKQTRLLARTQTRTYALTHEHMHAHSPQCMSK